MTVTEGYLRDVICNWDQSWKYELKIFWNWNIQVKQNLGPKIGSENILKDIMTHRLSKPTIYFLEMPTYFRGPKDYLISELHLIFHKVYHNICQKYIQKLVNFWFLIAVVYESVKKSNCGRSKRGIKMVKNNWDL